MVSLSVKDPVDRARRQQTQKDYYRQPRLQWVHWGATKAQHRKPFIPQNNTKVRTMQREVPWEEAQSA